MVSQANRKQKPKAGMNGCSKRRPVGDHMKLVGGCLKAGSLIRILGTVALFVGAMAMVAAAEPSANNRKIVQELVHVRADDGFVVPAVLAFPAEGMNFHSPAIIHHHGGPGGGPLGGAPRWAGEGLAARGYTCLSLKSRHSSDHPWRTFEEATLDIKALVDFLSNLGFKDIILTGHSLGSIRVARYLVDTQDPRIKALVHYAPTRNLSDWMRRGMSEELYWSTVDEASRAVAEGRGEHLLHIRFNLPPPSSPGQPFLLEQTAKVWLNWWGPAAQSLNTSAFPLLRVPMLLLSGDDDIFVTQEYMSGLKRSAKASPRVDILWYTGGVDHGFNPIQDKVVEDTAKWLADIGLEPRPRISLQLVDTRASDKRRLSGILYSPAAGMNKQGPAFVLLHGFTSDVLGSSSRAALAVPSSTPWVGVGLAQEGYTALAIHTRVSGLRNQMTNIFEEIALDIKAWIDYLEELGFSEVILEGHSFGGIRSSYYMSTTHDPRVKGIAYLAPTRDAPDWLARSAGKEKYDQMVAEARAAVERGEGSTHLIRAEFFMPPPAPPDKVPFEIFQYADSFLSTWKPGSNTVHTEKIPEVGVPILLLAGSKDVFVTEEYMQHLSKIAQDGADYVWYGGPNGANHGFNGYEARVCKDIVDWVRKRNLVRTSSKQ